MIREKHPLAGKTVKLIDDMGEITLNGAEFVVEDWMDNVANVELSKMPLFERIKIPVMLMYYVRMSKLGRETDCDVVYGKIDGIDGLGCAVNNDEILGLAEHSMDC